ncbi:cilia- and flagella-associated protein 43-like [Gadus chalcogrammus]|uniref:cilia- and flagella-associated protein 43-like n=1 Tax=Gadus chalcogrammus TaxID=1042646 RepID=UPI0024C4B07F|nr:cilia- and flagella-associated protein 43-like [Gadus chalcogrammus]
MDEIGSLEVRWAQGFAKQRVVFIDTITACYTCGNHIVFLNIDSKKRTVLQSPGKGIGAFTASGTSRVLAVSEQRLNPSIFVLSYPERKLKHELKGTATLDYTSLALSDVGPYLCCYSSLPDHTITVWNWENAEIICTQPQAGKDVIYLVFNPMNWQQICALGSKTLTVWNIEKSDTHHILMKRELHLPAADGSLIEREGPPSHIVNGRLTYWGPQMPASAIAGLKGVRADGFMPQERRTPRLTPLAACWTPAAELYVGCQEGYLLLANPDAPSVRILYNPTAPDANPELKDGGFQSLALHSDGLYVAGKDRLLHCLKVNGTRVEISQTLEVEEAIRTVVFSPDYNSLLLVSSSGQIYRHQPLKPGSMENILDVLTGGFAAAASMGQDTFVSVRECGELQQWSSEGDLTGSLSLRTQVSCLACCPASHYAAIGTLSGHLLFVDLSSAGRPRLVLKIHLYRRPVDCLVFDEGGNILVCASDSHIFLLDAKPSKTFAVIGYTVAPGRPVLSLSTQHKRGSERVQVLALCPGPKDPKNGGGGGGGGSSCVLGVGEIFACCEELKTLQRFKVPQDAGGVPGPTVCQLGPEEEVEGHPLGPSLLALSPHGSWLASVGRDGLLRLRTTAALDRYAEIECHSCRLGGAGGLSFSADGQTLVTAGLGDGSLVCTRLRTETSGSSEAGEATYYCQSAARQLENVLKVENAALGAMTEGPQGSLPPLGSPRPGTEEVSEVSDATEMSPELDEGDPNLTFDPTWLETREEAVLEAEQQRYSEKKEEIRKGIKQLLDTSGERMRANEELPDIWRLDGHEFNLDVGEQRRLEVDGEREVATVREEIEMGNLAKSYLRELLKRDCWDSMKVKGKAIKGFHSVLEVKNYPMKERTEKELDDLLRVESIRAIETANRITQQDVPHRRPSGGEEGEEGEEGEGGGYDVQAAALTGSFAGQLGCSNLHLYDQFNLHVTEQKINQITLLQDVICKVKKAFNGEFDGVRKQKEQEMSRVREKNRRMAEIMGDLEANQELWEPTLGDSEQPERALTVEDSEVGLEKYLTPQQKKIEEEKKKLEEQMLLAAKGDNSRDRGLGDMMGGAIQVKKEDILKKEVIQPEFAVSKPELQWSDEEKKIYKDYEKKAKDLSEEQDKYKKTLESEMKKMQASILESTQGFDEVLAKLFERKLKSETVIYQEELKIAHLVYSMLIEEEIRNRERELVLSMERRRADKNAIVEELRNVSEGVELCRKAYDNVVAEDRVTSGQGFRKQFFDVQAHVVDHLYKLFKHRPRVQRMRDQADNKPLISASRWAGAASDGLGQMLQAMEELDSPENTPAGLEPTVWERFCLVRRAKVEGEQQVES